MTKPHLFNIQLLNPQPYYFPGAWIEGVVQLRTGETISATALRLKLDADEHASWEEKRATTSDDKAEEIKSYSKNVELIDSYLTLWGYPKHSDASPLKIVPGSYVFPFCIQVPLVDLPPTSEFHRGGPGTLNFKAYVRYRFKAKIDIPSESDIEVTCPIRILPRIPLTSVAGWNVAVEQEDTKQVGCLCCKGGQLQVRARCLSSAVVLGGTLMCTAEIINNSNTNVIGVKMSLVQTNLFQAETNSHSEETVVSTDYPVVLKRGETFSNLSCGAAPGTVSVPDNANAGANQALSMQPFTLVVPLSAPPQFKGKAITSAYQLELRVRLEGTFVIDIRLKFTPTICTQETDIPVTAISVPTVLNPTGQPRSAVLLLPATKGQFPANFSFDGMNYRPDEQFNKSKQVTYPCFYDSNWHTVPASINSYNPGLVQALSAPTASAFL